jgi:nuclear pore complex protein Nup62
MYVCMYVYYLKFVYIYEICMPGWRVGYALFPSALTLSFRKVCINVCIYIYVCMYVCMYIYILFEVYTFSIIGDLHAWLACRLCPIPPCLDNQLQKCVHKCIYIYVYVCIYTYYLRYIHLVLLEICMPGWCVGYALYPPVMTLSFRKVCICAYIYIFMYIY